MQKSNKTNNTFASKQSSISIRVIIVLILAIVGAGFIPFEKEIQSEYDNSRAFDSAYNYQSKAYLTNKSCLQSAAESAGGDRYEYDRLAADCEPIYTDETIEILKFNNGLCNFRYDYSLHMTLDDCETFYLKDKKLYSDLEIKPAGGGKYHTEYDDEVDVKVVSGSSARIQLYHTVTCRAFGLICGNGDILDENTHMHFRLIIGKNYKIEKYSGVCDSGSGKAMIEDSVCVYIDSIPKSISIEDILK